jgi:hypothetical protein
LGGKECATSWRAGPDTKSGGHTPADLPANEAYYTKSGGIRPGLTHQTALFFVPCFL